MDLKKNLYLLGSILTTVIILYFLSLKPWLQRPTKSDFFFFDVAVDFNAPDICEKIHPLAHWKAGFAPVSIGYYRSRCYEQVAIKTRNMNLCSLVKPLSTLFLHGGNMNQSSCMKDIRSGLKFGNLSYKGYYQRSEFLPSLGFSEEKINRSHFNRISRDLYDDFYFYIKYKNVPEREEFLSAVRGF